MNDRDRAQWIDNDEGLYDWWKSSRLPKARFIRENRAEITASIEAVLSGDKPVGYLKYGS
jgi:hypothetical protein